LADLRALATALLVAAAVGMPCAAVPAVAADQSVATDQSGVLELAVGTEQPRVDFRFEDPRITESSGLALSVRHPHTVWTVNDSGDRARVFAVDTRTGATVGVHTFAATVRDVEALAVTPQGRMLVADIGDNGATREVVRVFWFDEPALGTTTGTRGALASWELAYPDGPHDAEALAVDPRSGRVLVVTKGRPGSVYALPASASRQRVNRLTRVGSAPDTVTDAVFLPDGSALAVRTYTSLHLLDPDSWTDQRTTLLPLQPQGETIALAPGESALLVGSEGKRSRVEQVPLPVLRASASPTASAGPRSSPASDSVTTGSLPPPAVAATSRSAAGDDGTPLVVNRGELVTGLGASAGLVLLAVLLVRLAGRHRR
jgi:hypothetical protein